MDDSLQLGNIIKRKNMLRMLAPSIVLALLVAFGCFRAYNSIALSSLRVPLVLTPQIQLDSEKTGARVTFRGAIADGEWLNVSDISDANEWIENPEELTLTAVKETPLLLALPFSKELQLVFDVGPEQGIVQITVDKTVERIDLYSDTVIPSGRGYAISLPQLSEKQTIYLPWGLSIGAFVLVLLLLLWLAYRKIELPCEVSRQEAWGNLLRSVCAFIIVWLHCSCGSLDIFEGDHNLWYISVVINSFTAFAVPCFYMLSGAYLLRREHGMRETLCHRVPKMVLPLFFWSFIYIIVNGNEVPKSFFKMLFEPQASHLWFMYCLLGIYMLLPILSKLYVTMGAKQKIYLIVLLLLVPGLLHDAQYLANKYAALPYFAVFWPDLGLFFMGAIFWEYRNWLQNKWRSCVLIFAGGFAITIAQTLYTSLRDAAPNKNFISCIGSVGVVLMASAAICLALSLRQTMEDIPNKVKKLIHGLGSISMGVYFVHVLAIQAFEPLLRSNGFLGTGLLGQLQAFVLAIVCFAVSAIVCWSGRKFSAIEKLF